jgi:Domain of unknown function (DUF6265)
MKTTVLSGVLVVSSLALSSDEPRIQDLAWMSGTWRGENRGVSMEEVWTGPDGGMMLALHKDVKGGRVTDWEFLRIEEQPDGVVYLASPKGAPATPFRLTELKGERVVFVNPEHDFPKRILYWRDGEGALHAAIDGGKGTKMIEWRWTRAP